MPLSRSGYASKACDADKPPFLFGEPEKERDAARARRRDGEGAYANCVTVGADAEAPFCCLGVPAFLYRDIDASALLGVLNESCCCCCCLEDAAARLDGVTGGRDDVVPTEDLSARDLLYTRYFSAAVVCQYTRLSSVFIHPPISGTALISALDGSRPFLLLKVRSHNFKSDLIVVRSIMKRMHEVSYE
jgi:hypothetical protein